MKLHFNGIHRTLATLLTSSLLLIQLAGRSQDYCPNLNLSDGDFTNWMGFVGTCCDINTPTAGIITGRHTIVTGTGYDPNTCGNVLLVPPGYSFSARLGNTNTGAEAEKLVYTLDVTSESDLLLYRYAVILEDPGHPQDEQPRFVAQVKDGNGQVIGCTQYAVTASQGLAGFETCGSELIYRNWTTVGVDLSAFTGQQVSLEFATGDCEQGGHFGMAYFVAECMPLQLDARYCMGDNSEATITAPEGFTYLWSTGSTNQEITIANPVNGTTYWCQMTSVTGCQATLYATLTPTSLEAEFTPVELCSALTVLDNATSFDNGEAESFLWNSSDGYSSTDTTFNHTFPGPGNYLVQLQSTNDLGCMDTISHVITVAESPMVSFNATDACVGTTLNLTANSSIGDGSSLSLYWTQDTLPSVPGNSYQLFSNADTVFNMALTCIADNGCIVTEESPVTFYDFPVASFTVADQCQFDAIQVTNASTTNSTTTNYSYFLEPTTLLSSLPEPINEMSESGSLDLMLILEDVHGTIGCADTSSMSFSVFPTPVVEFTGDTAMCEGELFNFYNASTISSGTFTHGWYLDGVLLTTNTNLLAPTIAGSGSYDLQLIEVADNGCSDSLMRTLWLYPQPDVTINAISSGCAPLAPGTVVNVTDYFSGITSYEWLLDDDVTSVTASNVLYFEEPGSHTVEVHITAGDAIQECAGADTIQVDVWAVPELLVEVGNLCSNDIEVTNNSVISSGTIATTDWQFGALFSSTLWDFAFGINDTDYGLYPISLAITSDHGCTVTWNDQLMIHPLPDVGFVAETPCSGENIGIVNTTTCADGSLLAGTSWYSSTTGESSSDFNWSPVAGGVGAYEVTLIQTSIYGCVDSLTRLLSIHPNPVASFVVNDICQYNIQTVENTSAFVPGVTEWQWFRDGVLVSSNEIPTFDTDISGPHTLELQMIDLWPEGMCDSYLSDDYVVFVTPQPACVGDTILCEGEQLLMTSAAYADNDEEFTNAWFENGELLFNSHDLYYYPDSGYHTFSMVSFNANCADTMYFQVRVVSVPDVVVTPLDTALCSPTNLSFTATIVGSAGNVTGRYWSVNDYPVSQEEVLELEISYPGYYEVVHEVTTMEYFQPCVATGSTGVTIWPIPVAWVDWVPEGLTEDNPDCELLMLAEGYAEYSWTMDNVELAQETSINLSFPTYFPDEHEICLGVTNQFQCVDSICRTLVIEDLPDCWVPNSFTPDNDGINDLFIPVFDNLKLIESYHLLIFNRQGDVVFDCEDPKKAWLGGYLSDYYCPVGVYEWMLTYRTHEGVTQELTGHVSLLR